MQNTEFNKLVPVALLSLLLAFSCFPVSVSYAAGEESRAHELSVMAADAAPALVADDETVEAGETVEIAVRITGNPGIIGATFVINYDSKLTLADVSSGDVFSGLDMTKPNDLKSGCKVHWDATDLSTEDVKDGAVLVLTFVVPQSAVQGDSYTVSVEADKVSGVLDVTDRDMNTVDLGSAKCTLTVAASTSAHVHSYGAWTTVRAASCTVAGSRERVCSGCGGKIVEEVAALGHSWDSGKVTKAATSTEAGVMTYTCTRCKEVKTESIPSSTTDGASLHMSDLEAKAGDTVSVDVRLAGNPGILGATVIATFDNGLVLKGISNGDAFRALEMTKPREMVSGCRIHWDSTDIADSDIQDGTIVTLTFELSQNANAGESYAVSVAAAKEGGQDDVYDRDVAPVTLKASSCKISVIPDAATHTHSYGAWATVNAASCTEAGSRERVCSGCGDKIVEEIAALGHSWDAGTVTKAATATETGVRTYTCTRCNEIRTETISATGSGSDSGSGSGQTTPVQPTPGGGQTPVTPVQPTPGGGQAPDVPVQPVPGDGGTGQETPATPEHVHSPGEWTVVSEPTCIAAGSRETTCSGCGEVVVEEIAALGHLWGEGVVTREATYDEPGSRTFTCERCGETRTEEIPKLSTAARISLSQATIDEIPAVTYNGYPQTPAPIVKLSGKILVAGSDYVVSYADNTNAGTAKMTITGKGAYEGVRTTTFTIEPSAQLIISQNVKFPMGKTASVWTSVMGAGKLSYVSNNTDVVRVDDQGRLTPVRAGDATITVTAAKTTNYKAASRLVFVTVTKGANSMVAKGKTVKVKSSKLKKKSQKVSARKAFSVKKAQGKVVYKKVSGDKNIIVAKSGNITVKKSVEKGDYKVQVKVKAKGNVNWKAKAKKVTMTVRVR